MGTKICRKCGRELPATLDYFQKRSDEKDGLRNKCRECCNSDFKVSVPEGYKQCHKCKRILPIDDFNKSQDTPDGLQHKCKDCKRQYREDHKEHINKRYKEREKERKEWRLEYKARNNEKIKAHKKQYREDHKEEIKEYNKKYREEHKEYFIQYKREHNHNAEYWQKNKERYRPYQHEWWKSHRELGCIYSRAYRSRAKKLDSTLTLEQWGVIKSYFDGKCAYCGKELPLAQEHFIPISKGGEYTHNNIVCACKSCNSSKNNKDFFEWYPKQPFYSKKRERVILEFLGYDKQGVQQLALMI